MKNKKEFIEQLVKIDFVEQSDCFGHYPFQMFVETEDGSYELNALALGGDVKSCYRRFKEYVDKNAKRVYLSLDFPSGGDIENDFVCIFSYENGVSEAMAITYQVEDGVVLNEITESEQLSKILDDFKYVVFDKVC